LVNRGAHRRGRPAPERWWWFALVSSPAWLQVAILPAVHGPATYEIGVAGLGVGFLLYLGYFSRNRRQHDRMRRDG
jgi:hypothetical protein